MDKWNYGIIGGGPAGYTAAMCLAKQGHSVVLFEKDKLGGTCLNKGCIPTKSFLHSAEMYSLTQKASEIGVNTDSFDFSKVVEKKDKTVEKVRKSLELAVKNSGVKIVYAEAVIIDKNTMRANEENYTVDNIIGATGAKPREIKGLEFDGEFILSSDDILNLTELPKSILIVGSGAIGIEWTRILSAFGVDVYVVEYAEHLLPAADIEVSKRVERIFKQKGIKYYLSDKVESINGNTITLKNGTSFNVDKILVAAGREAIIPKGADCSLIGDACQEIQLAHFAIHQAQELACGIPFNKKLTPAVIYGSPEIAWVGLREQDIDKTYSKRMLPITALGKSWCDDATDGFIKIITKNDKIYGAHIVSKEASSLIHILLVAIEQKIPLNKLKEICFAHPTYAEGIFELISQSV